MISTLLTLFVVGLVSIVVIGIALSLLGAVAGLAFVLLFKVAPILLVGYIVLRLISPRKKPAPEDKDWLET
jgi:hypothetical protein